VKKVPILALKMIKTHTRIKTCHSSCQSLRRHPTEIIYFISTKFLPPYSYLLNDCGIHEVKLSHPLLSHVWTSAPKDFPGGGDGARKMFIKTRAIKK